MKARIKTKHSKNGVLYIGVLHSDKITLSSREFDEYEDAEYWLIDRIKSEIDRKTLNNEDNNANKKV
jgi:hypothetical protein